MPGYANPSVGSVYTIRDAVYSPVRERWGISLVEGHKDDLYYVGNFRPLVSDSDELGIETVLYRKAGLKSKSPVRESEPVE